VIIALEGPDRAGKTALANELSARLNYPVFKSTRTPLKGQEVRESQAEDAALMDMLEATMPDVILDRFYPSEHVYGQVYQRDVDKNANHELHKRWKALRYRGQAMGFALLFNGTYTEISDAIYSRGSGDGEVDYATIKLLNDRYRDFMRDDYGWRVLNAEKSLGELVVRVLLALADERPHKDVVYMDMARTAAKRATCLSRHNGSVLLSHDGHVIATGYNGSPVGMEHPRVCPRLEQGVASGSSLELCNDVHAEENCIVQAAKLGVSVTGGTLYTVMSPCHRCFRMLANAGIKEVVYEREYGDVRALNMVVPSIKLRPLGA
jgi:dCMP deaminase